MKRIFSCIAVVAVVVLACSYGYATDPNPWSQDISVVMPSVGSGTLTVTVQGGTGISFDPSSAALTDPWLVSPQYLRVQYSATYNSVNCGVRIVTDIASKLTLVGSETVANYMAPATSADGKSLYSGLIYQPDLDLGVTGEDPSRRVVLAWQVYSNPPTGNRTKPKSTVVANVLTDYTAPTGTPPKSNFADADYAKTVGLWNSAWAYISDKSDQGFPSGVWDYASSGVTYPIIVSGIRDTSYGNLSQHPVESVDASTNPIARPADGDIAVYLAARFANTNYGSTPFAYMLPAGTYTNKLYVEMLHE